MTRVRVARAGRGMLGQRSIVRVVSTGVLLFATASAGAQWSVTNLNPGPEYRSQAFAIDGHAQAGEFESDVSAHACVWSGSVESLIDLHPTGLARSSQATAVSGGTQVGFVTSYENRRQAAMWTGSASSYVNLNPPGASSSYGYGVSGDRQVGFASFPDRRGGAVIWHGSAESYKVITPAPYTTARAEAISGDSIGGVGSLNGMDRALLWTNDGDVWVDLHPDGFERDRSEVLGVSATQQVGWTRYQNQVRAALWSGSAGSWIELHPEGAAESKALGVFDGYQVGFARYSDVPHAAIWTGSAGSWIDLNQFLPPSYLKSIATGVWHDEHKLYVVGYAATSASPEAFIWSMPIPAPGAAMPLAIAAMVGMRRVRRRAVKAADAATLQLRAPTID